ncbi:imidazoleglycerol-phosphate dehydratase HisB [Candidatus Vidania fulgoroideorum]
MNKEFFLERKTTETDISLRISLDNNLVFVNINTGIAFFDHMLRQLCFHGNFSMNLICKGDLNVDNHHIIEDVGIVFGKLFKKIIKEKSYKRYGFYYIPMDESLTRINIDICFRPYLIFNVPKSNKNIFGGFSIDNLYEFFKSFTNYSLTTLHIENYGRDIHHRIESIFKCFGYVINHVLKLKTNDKKTTK